MKLQDSSKMRPSRIFCKSYALNKLGKLFDIIYIIIIIIIFIARHRLFKPVRTSKKDEIQRHLFKVDFANNGLDAININNILHHEIVQSKLSN